MKVPHMDESDKTPERMPSFQLLYTKRPDITRMPGLFVADAYTTISDILYTVAEWLY